MHNNIHEFIVNERSIKKIRFYDFKKESLHKYKNNSLNPIDRFMTYKNNSKSIECDICKLSDSIYSNLWGWNYKNRFDVPKKASENLKKQWNRYSPDTMNSFGTTYRQALKINNNDRESIYDNNCLEIFAILTHTIGNFTLTPFHLKSQDNQSFNQYRGFNLGKYFVYDYFDLTLKLIKEVVTENIYRDFIDFFMLNDYVDKNYDILPLMESHSKFLTREKLSLDEPKQFLPRCNDELNEYLYNVNNVILKRSNRIIERLENDFTESQINKNFT